MMRKRQSGLFIDKNNKPVKTAGGIYMRQEYFLGWIPPICKTANSLVMCCPAMLAAHINITNCFFPDSLQGTTLR